MTTPLKTDESGSALVYILIAIALLAALTVTFMEPSSQQATSQNTFQTVADLNSQINSIRSSVQECVLNYPAGESGLVGKSNFPYPVNPTSTYLASPDAADEVRNIRCPGNPGGASNNHADIFAGSSGKFLPPAPDLFGEWMYSNSQDGVFFYTSTNKTDAFLQTALTKLDEQFAECEADVVDAAGGAEDLLSGGGLQCAAGNTCFRVWIIARPGNQYNGDTDGDEGACP
jgi:hypothetical protein